MKELFDSIRYEDMTPDLQFVADSCGIETARQLLRTLPGISIYIPKMAKMESFIHRYIEENRTKNIKHIAKELNVSVSCLKKYF